MYKMYCRTYTIINNSSSSDTHSNLKDFISPGAGLVVGGTGSYSTWMFYCTTVVWTILCSTSAFFFFAFRNSGIQANAKIVRKTKQNKKKQNKNVTWWTDIFSLDLVRLSEDIIISLSLFMCSNHSIILLSNQRMKRMVTTQELAYES